MSEVTRLDGRDLIAASAERLRTGASWEDVERDLNAALADGRIDSATADWAHRRTRTVAGHDTMKWRCWAKVVAFIHEDRRAGSWTDRLQERLGRKPRLGAALLELAQAQVDSGYPGEGAETLYRAWTVLANHGNAGQQGACRDLQARCAASAARWAECADYARNAAGLLTDAGMYMQAGRAQVRAAEAAVHLGDESAALLAAREAELSAARADDYGRATIFMALIDYFRTVGNVPKARRFADPALAAARASGQVTAIAGALESVGILTALEGDPDGGVADLLRAAEQLRAAGVVDQAVNTQLSAAQLAIGAEQLAQAEKLLAQVGSDADATANPVHRARLLILQGRLAHAAGDETTAGARMQEGIAVLQAAGFSPAAAGITIVARDAGHG